MSQSLKKKIGTKLLKKSVLTLEDLELLGEINDYCNRPK
jgi:hypothetical protein